MATVYPEHAKMRAIKDRAQVVGDFIEWIQSEYNTDFAVWKTSSWICDIHGEIAENRVGRKELCPDCPADAYRKVFWRPEGYYPIRKSTEQLLAEFFDIDLHKIEAEKRAMLDTIRKG